MAARPAAAKTQLGLGLALTAHRHSLILRRINKDVVKLVEPVAEILGHRNGYNGQLQRWRLGNRLIEFAGCEHEDDKHRFKGDPHLWVIKHWAPWLDPLHPRPAQPGELRWFTTGPDGEDAEVDGRGPHLVGGEQVLARSRTYLPARLSDNPDQVPRLRLLPGADGVKNPDQRIRGAGRGRG